MLQQSYDRGAHIHHLLIDVVYPLIDDALTHPALHVLVKKSQQQMLRLLIGEDFQFVGILDVHNLIADIVGCLDKVDQWMTGKTYAVVVSLYLTDAQVVGYLQIDVLLAVEETAFAFLPCHG